MDPSFVAGLTSTLNDVVFAASDTARIQTATSTLSNTYFTSPMCVPALIDIGSSSEHWQIRQLCAVELRKRSPKHWLELEDSVRSACKAKLLEIILREPHALARHTIARAISTIAQMEVTEGTWPELLPFVNQCCNAAVAGHREVGVYILQTLFELSADHFTEHFSEVMATLRARLADPESLTVRSHAVTAIGELATYVEEENKADVRAIQDTIPGILSVIEQNISAGEDDQAKKGLEILETFLTLETPLLNKHFAQVIEFTLKIGGTQEVDEEVRCAAISFTMWACLYKKSKIQRLRLVAPILQHVMPVAAEGEPEDSDDESPARVAFKVVSTLGRSMPPQQFFPFVMQIISEYAQSQDPGHRKAAMMSFAVSIEGCAEYMTPKIPELLPLIYGGLQDSDPSVRRAACIALAVLAEEVESAVTENHSTLLPLIVNVMNDGGSEIVKHACGALDAILESLGDAIVPYLPSLMERLVLLLDSSTSQGNSDIGVTVCGAIGSAAHAAQSSFAPYFNETVSRLSQLMALTPTEGSNDPAEETKYSLRGAATDTLGNIADACGPELFRPHLPNLMGLALQGLHLKTPRLREGSFFFFALMARVFGEEVCSVADGRFLSLVVPELVASCQLDEASNLAARLNGASNASSEDLSSTDPEELLDDEGIEGEDEEADFLRLSTAVADEKEVAADCMGEIFVNTRSHFLPYVTTCTDELVKLADHFSDGVRKAAISSLFSFLTTFHTMSLPSDSSESPWSPGLPLSKPVHENVSTLIQLVMPLVVGLWTQEEDRMVVVQIMQELGETAKTIGPALFAGEAEGPQLLEQTGTNLKAVFEHKHECQLLDAADFDDEEDSKASGDGTSGDEDEVAEQDALLTAAACDLLGAMSMILGDQFISFLRVILPDLLKLYKPTKPTSERSSVIGTLSELALSLGPSVTDFTEPFYNLLKQGLQDPEAEVRSNAAYGMGVLVEKTTVDMSGQYPEILGELSKVFQTEKPLPNLLDNAVGALARLIRAHPSALDLNEILPVMIRSLPLRADFQENEPVFLCILTLAHSQSPALAPHSATLKELCTNVLNQGDEALLSEGTRAEVARLQQML
ncbi:MAG: armadillo-type protein [Piptocephalis tieghemiana]|nr:MAG: armadillo-type protein [Piptocephalis tieghemiana]